MKSKPLIVTMDDLDPSMLSQACGAVIDALSKYPKAYKVGALHTLLVSFPVPYEVIEHERK